MLLDHILDAVTDSSVITANKLSQQSKDVKFDENAKYQVRKRLLQGEKILNISEELGIPYKKVYTYWDYWRPHVKEFSLESLTRKSKGRKCIFNCKSKRGTRQLRDLELKQFRQMKKTGDKTTLSSCQKFQKRNLKKLRAFIPIRKVHIPNRMKLKFVKIIDEGVSIGKLSKELNVNKLTIESWILNRDLLIKSSASAESKNY